MSRLSRATSVVPMHAASARRSLLAALVAVAMGGCGGEDSAPTDVERMLRAGLTTTQPEVLCERTLSAKLVMRVYGGVEQCLAAERGSAASRMPARSAESPVSRSTATAARRSSR